MLKLDNNSPLSFSLILTNGRKIATIGEAADYLAELHSDQLDQSYWRVAMQMLDHTLREAAYLRAATMSLRTALVLDGILASPHPLDNP